MIRMKYVPVANLNPKYDIEIKSDRWKIIVFMRDGVTFTCQSIYSSQSEAETVIIRARERDMRRPNMRIKDLRPLYYTRKDVSHAIPIPIK